MSARDDVGNDAAAGGHASEPPHHENTVAETVVRGMPPLETLPESRLTLETLSPCAPTELTIPEAYALAVDLDSGLLPFARLLECRSSDRLELVTFEVDVELAQRAVHDIRHVEPLAALFTRKSPECGPELLALRADFPADAPHINLRPWEYPRSLCLYDVRFRDLRAQWTPARFIARIRDWLRQTARGELHAPDQPLEPILMDTDRWVVLPAALRDQAIASTTDQAVVSHVSLSFRGRGTRFGKPVLVGTLTPPLDAEQSDLSASASVVRVAPRTHGVIRHTPKTLAELHTMLSTDGDDLLGTLRRAFREWDHPSRSLADGFGLILFVPKRRSPSEPVEHVETWAFFTNRTVGEVGVDIGAWQMSDGVPGIVLFPDAHSDGRNVLLRLGDPVFTATRSDLAEYNGANAPDERRIVSIGAGALGSQVMLNAARAAFGRWSVIDEDVLLPHNLARHGLPGSAVGYPKAMATTVIGNGFADDDPVHTGVHADVLSPDVERETVDTMLHDADIVVDLSASVTVARMLARDDARVPRCISMFLSPTGLDLIMLAEDTERRTPVDVLEMQFYHALAHDEALAGLLAGALSHVRYGRSCRDVSVEIPQALVALHAGIATLALQQQMERPAARALVWRADPDALTVRHVEIPVRDARECTIASWRIITDTGVLDQLHRERVAKLPNETGGVVLGTYDFVRRIVYITDAIPSPSDSQEQRTSYVRGCAGLRDEIERVAVATARQVHYIGEWHSHPANVSCLPSPCDRNLFSWLAEEMQPDGYPPLMLIVGDGGLTVPYLGRIDDVDAYPAELWTATTAPAA